MLSRRPDIARHVRQLAIKLASYSSSESSVASFALKQLAMTKRLDALVKFTWDVDEIPSNDDVWFALRIGCPQLRYISTNIGMRLPAPSSHLFDFVDLHGFSLTLKPGFYEHHIDTFFDEESFSSQRLWEMLIHRCPNLEELSFNGTSTLPVDVHSLIQGRWPKLRQLSLGDVSIDWVPGHIGLSQKRPFIEFLEAHPHIAGLSLSRHTIQANHLTSLDQTIHQLTSFSGTLQQLQAIPHAYATLKSISVREPIMTREISALAVAGILQGMTALEELKVSFMLQSTYDSGSLLRSLTGACPRLRHLDLTCGHKPSFQLVQ
ncbi:hypothetical protein AX16_002025 [Volvariella volvacea WC 439]|nr:hypothetical protein AX16_002025 [Volvariella volvacea WC 439]